MADKVDAELKRLYEEVQGMLGKLRDMQNAKTKHIQARHQLGAQKSENELVRSELSHLEPGAGVYKLFGPALIAQDPADAKTIVERRLEFVTKEIQRIEDLITSTEKEEDEMRGRIVKIQQQMQARQQQMAAATEAKA